MAGLEKRYPLREGGDLAMLTIEALPMELCVCKVEDWSQVDLSRGWCFTGCTDTEKSLVCRVQDAPDNTVARDDGWRAMRVRGQLDFSLTGVLADISRVLAVKHISIFAISTYDTDYILTHEADLERALEVLEADGYEVMWM